MRGIILNENLSIKVANGSMAIGDTTRQNQQVLLMANKGDFKYRPMRGVGLKRFLETSRTEELAREIRSEFTIDGMTVNKIQVNNGKLEVEASYED
jgi:hypothetical protein